MTQPTALATKPPETPAPTKASFTAVPQAVTSPPATPAAVTPPTATPSAVTPKPVTPAPAKATPKVTAAPVVYYANCADARAAGAAPIYRGEAGYRSALDRDNDGIACE